MAQCAFVHTNEPALVRARCSCLQGASKFTFMSRWGGCAVPGAFNKHTVAGRGQPSGEAKKMHKKKNTNRERQSSRVAAGRRGVAKLEGGRGGASREPQEPNDTI